MKSTVSLKVSTVFIALLLFTLSACKSDTKKKEETQEQEEMLKPGVLEVVTRSMEFITQDTIPSGWTTFVYKNLSAEPHFILIDRYPEGKSIADTKAEVFPPFDEGMALIMEGKNEEAMEAFGKLPEWFSDIVFTGGPGMISAGRTATTTVYLEPGYYILECYVKMPNGRFHSSMGMAKPLIVTNESNGVSPPNASVDISISSEEGISYTGTPVKGSTTFSVTYDDQTVHENFVGHDVNLAKIEDGADLEALETWMNWAVPNGLMSSTVPEGVTFIGGTNDAPAESTQYFEVDLEPGKYVLISEVPNTLEKGMLKTFTVGE